MRAVEITEFGGPEAVTVRDDVADSESESESEPKAGQVIIEVDQCGVNFADTLLRQDGYIAAATLPLIPGSEVVGRAADGRRLAAMTPSGGYAEMAGIPEDYAFPVPEEVDDFTAVELLAQGLTAWWLINNVGRVQPGGSVVVHAAAGGVGSLAVQLANRTARAGSSLRPAPQKRALALSLGADAAVDPAAEDLTTALCDANNGDGVDAVLEMTGGRVTDQSLAALAPFGRLAFYGMASLTEPEKVSPRVLQRQSTTISGLLADGRLPPPGKARHGLCRLAGISDSGPSPRRQGRRLPDVTDPHCPRSPPQPPHHRQTHPRSSTMTPVRTCG